MSVVGTVSVACPGCGSARECTLVQSINARQAPSAKQKLLVGELNVMTCDCGKQVQLAATVVFADPDADLLIQVCPGGETEMAKAAELIRAVGATGTRRIVPSLNALVEKVKIADAGLEDRTVEMIKVLLLASLPEPDLERVLLFDAIDRDAEVICWLRFDPDGPQRVASPLATYDKLVQRPRPADDELRIDRAWAVDAVRAMIAAAN